jgi:beta-glucosidase
VMLSRGEKKTISFVLPAKAVAYWDEATNGWKVEPTPLEVEVGASSSDIRARKTIQIR